MKAEIKTIDNLQQLVITIPMQAPTSSKSGLTKIVAGSSGPKSTTASVEGKPVTVNVTAWIKP